MNEATMLGAFIFARMAMKKLISTKIINNEQKCWASKTSIVFLFIRTFLKFTAMAI